MNITFFNSTYKMPITLQSEVAECGLASLSMCLNYFGLPVTLPLLRGKYQLGKKGSSMYDLSTVCQNEGMIGDVYECEMDSIRELPLPAVVHWDLAHFIVLKSIKKNKFVIHDPAIGERTIALEEFAKHFTGYAMSVQKGQNEGFEESKTYWEKQNEIGASPLTFTGLFTRSHGLAKGLSNLIILTFAAQLIVMLFPMVTQLVIDDFVATGEKINLVSIIIGGLGLTAFVFLVRMIRGWASIFLGYHWHAGFSSYFFQRLVRLPMSFFESRNIADVNTKFRVLDRLKNSFTEQLVAGLIDGMMSLITLFIMFLFMPQLAIVSIVFLIVYGVFRSQLIKKEVQFAGELFAESIRESHTFFETISNMLAVKLYGRESARYQYWKAFYLKKMKATVATSKLTLWYTSANEMLGHAERLIILYIGALAVIEQEITLGMMFAFFAYREIFSTQSKSLLDNALSFKVLRVDLDRLSDIEIEKVEANMLGDNETKNIIKGTVCVENLSYRYDGDNITLLDDLTFSIKKGEHVVITGPSGSGKTTLLKLLAGVMEPTSGHILVDGKKLTEIGHHHYRKYVAIISQQEGLISGSLIDNIAFSSSHIDVEQVYQAAKNAHVFEEINNMPMQFHSIVAGSHSCSLSGGQVQRILIARALYSNPTILFMDEATSALDPAMEIKVSKTLRDMNITRISVAHRKETIATADREFKLKNANAK